MDKIEANPNRARENRLPARDVLLDPDRNIWVKMGLPPVNPQNSVLFLIPNEPYVFKVDELLVSDQSHNNLKLDDVTVVFGHGHNIGNKWVFNNGQEVDETVKAFEKYAKGNQIPPH